MLMGGGLIILVYSLWLKRRYNRVVSGRLHELEPPRRVDFADPGGSIREPERRRTGTG